MSVMPFRANLAQLNPSFGAYALAPTPAKLNGNSDAARAVIDGCEDGQRYLHQFAVAGPHAPMRPTNGAATANQTIAISEFDGMCYNLGKQTADGQTAFTRVGFVTDGTAGCAGEYAIKAPGGQASVGGFTGTCTNQMWGMLSVAYVDQAAQVGARGGCMVSAGGHNGCDVALPGLPASKNATVSVRNWRYGQIAFNPALAVMALLRILCRVDRARSSETIYNASVDLRTASVLASTRTSAFGRWIVGTFRALRGFHPLPIPSLEHPERLRANETRTTTLGVRTCYFGSAGIALTFGGYQKAEVHQSVVETARDDNDSISFTWTQTRLRSARGFAVVPGGLSIDSGTHSPDVRTRAFKLDLRPGDEARNADVRAALAAYRAFAQALNKAKNGDEEDAAFDAMVAHPSVAKLRAQDAFGHTLDVEDDSITAGKDAVRSREFGTRMVLFPNGLWAEVLPQGFEQAMTTSRERRDLQRTLKDPMHGKRTFDIKVNQRQTLGGPNGRRENQVVAVVTHPDDVDQASVVVGSRFHMSRVDESEVQRLIVNPLDNHLDAHLMPLRGAGWRVSRDVTVERELGGDELTKLAQLHNPHNDAAREDVVAGSGVDANAFATLLETLNAPNATRMEQCQGVQTFIGAAGLPALGALRRALGADAPQTEAKNWALHTSSNAYSSPQKAFDALQARTLDPGVRQSRSFMREAASLSKTFEAAKDLAGHDPFLATSDRQNLIAEQERYLVALKAYAQPVPEFTDEKKSAAEPKTGDVVHGDVALAVQRFVREHSEPRFCDDPKPAREACIALLRRYTVLSSTGSQANALRGLLRPWLS